MASERIPITQAETVALMEHTRGRHLHVPMELGTGCLLLDVTKPNDLAIGRELLRTREQDQADKDQVGDPR